MSNMPYLHSKDAALFVYLAWGTRAGLPVLGDDQIRQAAYLAITLRIRSQFCHVLAIDGTPGRIHLIVRFPPSIPISIVARMAQDAGGEAVAHLYEMFHGLSLFPERLWDRDYTCHTLQQTEAAEAPAYLRQQIVAERGSRSPVQENSSARNKSQAAGRADIAQPNQVYCGPYVRRRNTAGSCAVERRG